MPAEKRVCLCVCVWGCGEGVATYILVLKEIKGKGKHSCLSFSGNMGAGCLAFNLTIWCHRINLNFHGGCFETPRVNENLHSQSSEALSVVLVQWLPSPWFTSSIT